VTEERLTADQEVDQLVTAPKLKPGDKVLIALTDHADPANFRRVLTELGQAFPGVTFTVLDGVRQVLVYPAEAQP
jgi:hypothetical protein